jgi:hypothetical protein
MLIVSNCKTTTTTKNAQRSASYKLPLFEKKNILVAETKQQLCTISKWEILRPV